MKDYDNTNTGVLFPNVDKEGNQPDVRGSFTDENGKEFWIAGWNKKSKKGGKYISLAFEAKEDKAGQKSTGKNQKVKGKKDEEDDFFN